MILTLATSPILAVVAGCNGGDNPRMVDVPVFKPSEADLKKPTGRPAGYGESKKYQDAMDKY